MLLMHQEISAMMLVMNFHGGDGYAEYEMEYKASESYPENFIAYPPPAKIPAGLQELVAVQLVKYVM